MCILSKTLFKINFKFEINNFFQFITLVKHFKTLHLCIY